VTGGPVAGTDVGHPPYRDGILGHQCDRRLESFAPSYSQYLLLALKKHTIRETIKLESIHGKHFVEQKNKGRKLESEKT
jgi:hypothetical protein